MDHRFAVVFGGSARTVRAPMSLNRSEQMVFDYVQAHPEERQFWMDKVRALAARTSDEHAAAAQIADQLWNYYEERAAVVSPFRDVVRREGLHRTSMRNLAEYLLRLWTVPKAKKKKVFPENDGPVIA